MEAQDQALVNPDRFHLFVGEDVLGYKIVNFHGTPDANNRVVGVRALLYLQLPATAKIYNSKSQVLTVDLRATEKYCTDVCRVEGVQFLGEPEAVNKALTLFQANQGYLVSGYAKAFVYELGKVAQEPNAGRTGQICTQGLHFFTDAASAVSNYAGLEEMACLEPIVTQRLNQTRKLICAFHTRPTVSLPSRPLEIYEGEIPKDSALANLLHMTLSLE